MTEYKIEKSIKGESGKYQLLEYVDKKWRTCGIYFNKRDVVNAMDKCRGNKNDR